MLLDGDTLPDVLTEHGNGVRKKTFGVPEVAGDEVVVVEPAEKDPSDTKSRLAKAEA